MKWRRPSISLLLLTVFLLFSSHTSDIKLWDDTDETTIRSIYDEALLRGQSYSNLHDLCKNIGHRLTGSPQAEQAVQWGYEVLKAMNPDTVYLQEIEAPKWVRGENEYVKILHSNPSLNMDLEACALGMSVGTNGPLSGEVVEVHNFTELEELGEKQLKGKIVFYNRPMDRSLVNTFAAYGGCVDQRWGGAMEAAKYGAVGVLVRSMTTKSDHDPHTGSMGYKDGVKKIPSMALSGASADKLHTALGNSRTVKVEMFSDCSDEGMVKTHNVIAEIRGSEHPEQIIAFGGHLDSWDKGEGAHDDGAGIVHSMEAFRLFLANNIRPKHTLRVVLFMNEENGNFGGKTYAKIAADNKEDHIAAIESDRGGFVPRGFSINGHDKQVLMVQGFKELLEPYGLHLFETGFAGVDIYPLQTEENKINPNLLMLGLYPDPQRYFDYHHSDEDVFENVNQRELELGAASMASIIFLIDKYWEAYFNV